MIAEDPVFLALSEISRAEELLESWKFMTVDLREESHRKLIAARIREAARLCMTAAQRLDTREAEHEDELRRLFR